MGPPEDHADARVKHPPGSSPSRDKWNDILKEIDIENSKTIKTKSHWARNSGRSGAPEWLDSYSQQMEDQEQEKERQEAKRAKRETEKKRVEFIRIALTAQDEAKELKRQLRLNKWRIKRENDTDTPTFCDSGSNVDVINHDTALWLEDLGFEYQARKPGEGSDYIVFGKKGAQSEVIGYVEGEGLVDRLAVVKEIEANLISVNTFTQQGMEVIFDQDCVKVMQGDTLR